MKAQISGLLIVCFAFALVGCEAPDTENGAEVDQQAVRQSIEAQNARFERYMENQQFDSLATLYTASGQLMAPNSPTLSDESMMAWFEGATEMGASGIDLQTTEVEAAQDFAYEVGNYTLFGPENMEIDNGKYIVVWKQEDGEWKLHRDIFNSNVAPAEGPEGEAGAPSDTTQS